MIIIMHGVALALAAAAAANDALTDGATIECPGAYGGHLQGIATDGAGAIYWSFTVHIVKTDTQGTVLKVVEAPSHQGDLVCHDGRVYVAVNLGKFNREPGEADSWVYVYDTDNLALVAKHEVQEVVHGAGGITYRDGHFYVIGGLPDNYQENYVYEYDTDIHFIKRHVVNSGHTHLGIQTACYADGCFWFGCYGSPRLLLKTDESFRMLGRYEEDWSYGVAVLEDGRFLRGTTTPVKEIRQWRGAAAIDTPGKTRNQL
ncbi:MAG TPA: hypothetical protein ENN80_06390 [Candidatus Hydrogenedentes bacterium]|nr:hypothetical protein [Candidatus Hydrogenedentota bacterium]